jgi:hypothetical protein
MPVLPKPVLPGPIVLPGQAALPKQTALPGPVVRPRQTALPEPMVLPGPMVRSRWWVVLPGPALMWSSPVAGRWTL